MVFRGAGEDEEHFERCVRSLVEEIMFSGAPLLAAEVTATDSRGQTGPLKSLLGKKLGRGFFHKDTKLYMSDSGTFKNKYKIPVKIMMATSIIISLPFVASEGWRWSYSGHSAFSFLKRRAR